MFEKAVETSPRNAVTSHYLAQSYMRMGQKQKAEIFLNRAISLSYDQLQVNPRDASTLGNLALCYAAKGQLSEARTFLAQARAIDKADGELLYDSAILATADGEYAEALSALRGALQEGYSWEFCLSDPDLQKLREWPGFTTLRKQFGAH